MRSWSVLESKSAAHENNAGTRSQQKAPASTQDSARRQGGGYRRQVGGRERRVARCRSVGSKAKEKGESITVAEGTIAMYRSTHGVDLILCSRTARPVRSPARYGARNVSSEARSRVREHGRIVRKGGSRKASVGCRSESVLLNSAYDLPRATARGLGQFCESADGSTQGCDLVRRFPSQKRPRFGRVGPRKPSGTHRRV